MAHRVLDEAAEAHCHAHEETIAASRVHAQYFGYSELLFFASGNPTFHTRQDTPANTGPELLEPIARLIKSAFQQIIATIE